MTENFIQTTTRRDFLGKCAACAAVMPTLTVFPVSFVTGAEAAPRPKKKARVRLLFLYPDPSKPIWPNIGYDFDGRIRVLTDKLVRGCPGTEFLPETVMSGVADAAKKVLEKDAEIDGYLIYMVGCLWGVTPQTIAAGGKPVVMVDELVSASIYGSSEE